MAYADDKTRVSIFIDSDLVERIDASLKKADCKSRNEFVLSALQFYLGYLYSDEDSAYLASSIDSSISSAVKSMEDRTAKVLFKLTVEMSMMMNILAANLEIDEEVLKKLRAKCIKDLNTSFSSLSFEKLIK